MHKQQSALPARGIANTLGLLRYSTYFAAWCILAVVATHFICITAQQQITRSIC